MPGGGWGRQCLEGDEGREEGGERRGRREQGSGSVQEVSLGCKTVSFIVKKGLRMI